MKITIRRIDRTITLYTVLMGLYAIMPFVDSVSGAFHDVYPVGQIYRIITFIYMFFLLAKNSKKEFVHVLVPFLIFILFQGLISASYFVKSIQDVVKLFTPITAISLFWILLDKKKIQKNSIFKLLDAWSIIYPLLIIIPGILGLGAAAYDGETGWKGFFYAVNEISFIMSSLVMYLFWKLHRNINVKNVVVLLLNCTCVLLIGTKTGYATIAFFLAVFLIAFIREKKNRLKGCVLILIIIVVIALKYEKLQDLTSDIYHRWLYQSSISNSTIDFLTSHRLRRFKESIRIFFDGFYLLFGWGFGTESVRFPNMEMDFFDLLFKTGVIGIAYVCKYYFTRVGRFLKGNPWGGLIAIWSLALSFGAGHVLFFGQSGMMIAINFIYAYIIYCEKNRGLLIS